MKSSAPVKISIVFGCIIMALSISACKKNNAETDDGSGNKNNFTGPQTPAGDRVELSLDSIYLYAQQIYFWNDALPAYDVFSPRKYKSSPEINGYNQELFAITRLKINPATGKPYEYNPFDPTDTKYSYINDITLNNPDATASVPGTKANVDLEGNGNDIGIRAIYYLTSNKAPRPYKLFVTAVYPGSPAEAAGVKRGWLINKVNGQTIGTSYDGEEATVQNALGSSSVTLEGVNYADKVPFSLTLQKKSYKSSPVYASKVFNRGGKSIGYLSYARFSALTNFNAPSDANLDPVFDTFSGANITDLIVDLRYNGGGYIESAEYLANLIAPSSTSGKKMFTEIYNSTMQTGKASILSNQPLLNAAGKVQYGPNGKMRTYADLDYSATATNTNTSFSKKGNVNGISNVVFIVSNNTASASELLINSLKPYLNVKLVGDTTYGKPVGFFPVTIQNRYEVFFSLFETRNANNEGGYYTGMVPTVLNLNDDPTYVFGDERDNYLSLALNLIAPVAPAGKTAAVREKQTAPVISTQLRPVNPKAEFTGMIERKGGRRK